jgi:hypothetical protein
MNALLDDSFEVSPKASSYFFVNVHLFTSDMCFLVVESAITDTSSEGLYFRKLPVIFTDQ